MAELPERCDISAAEAGWRFADVYGPAREIIAAVLSVPPRLGRDVRPPIVFVTKEGEYEGCRFRIVGLKNSEGRWTEVVELHPL